MPEKDECESTKLSTFSFSSSKENVNKRKQSKLDMFVSEDFQTTPLIKYGNQSTVSKHQLKQRPMFDSLKLDKDIHKQTQKRSKQKTFTSTPLKNSHYQKQSDNNIHNSTSVENLSPIQKYLPYYTNGASGFKYTPRLMMTPEKGKMCASSTPSLTEIPEYHQNTQDGHLGGKKKNHNNSKRHNNSTIPDTYAINTEILMPNSNTQNKDYYSDLSENLNNFSTECVSMTTDSSVYPMSDYETTGSSLSTYKTSLTQDDTDHSLSHYQENDNSTFEAKSKTSKIQNKKLNFPSTTEKPTFTSLEDDFVYMPLNTRASAMNRTGDILNLYKRSSNSADSLNFSSTTDKGQASGGAMSGVSSPTPGDEFPFHLSSSTQINGMDGNVFTSKQIVNETTDIEHNQELDAHIERNSLDLQNNSNCEPFKAGVPKMEEVLNEMCTLEEQDKSQPSIPDQDHPLRQSTLQEPVCSMTESFEADKYFEAEEQLKMMAEEHFQQSDKSHVDNSTVHLEEDEDSLTDTTEHGVYKEVNITDKSLTVKPDDSFNTSTAAINQLENNSQSKLTGVLCSSAEIKVAYSADSKKAARQEQNVSGSFQKGEIDSDAVKGEKSIAIDTEYESIAQQLVTKLHEFQNGLNDVNNEKNTNCVSETSFYEMSQQFKHANAPTRISIDEDVNEEQIVENVMSDSIQDPEISSGNIKFIQASIVKEENEPTITAIVTNDKSWSTASNIPIEKAAIMNSELQTAKVKTEFTDTTISPVKTDKATVMHTELRNLEVKTQFADASTSPINWSTRLENRDSALSPTPQIEYRCIGTQCSFNDIGVHTLVQLARKSLKKPNKVVNK